MRTREKTDNPPPLTQPPPRRQAATESFSSRFDPNTKLGKEVAASSLCSECRACFPPTSEKQMAGLWAPHPESLGRRIPSAAPLPPPRFPNPRGKLLSPLIAAICFLLSIANRTSGPRVCVQGGGVPSREVGGHGVERQRRTQLKRLS